MVQDLSLTGEPLGALYEPRATHDDVERYALNDSQLEFFRENGYVAGIRVLDEEQVETLREELTTLMDPSHPGHELFHEYHSNESVDPDTVLFHALGAWRVTPGFHDLLWHPAFTVPAAQLLEGSVRFWHDQLFCKPARHGGVVAWHQDYSYWTRTRPLAHLTCWIGLDDSTRDNGCLHYVPGSHRWELLPVTGLAGDMQAVKEVLDEEQRKQFGRAVPVELRKGEASFHHALTLHGSYENRTDRPRRATVINVFRDGVRSDQDEPLLEGVDAIPKGQTMGGRFFPLLREAAASIA